MSRRTPSRCVKLVCSNDILDKAFCFTKVTNEQPAGPPIITPSHFLGVVPEAAMSYGSLPEVPDESPPASRRQARHTLTGAALVCALLVCVRQAARTTATALAARTPARDAAVQGDGLVLASTIVNTTMPLVAECTLELSGRYWIQVREDVARGALRFGALLGAHAQRTARRSYPGTPLTERVSRCGPSGVSRRTRACFPSRFTWRSCVRTRNTRSRCGRRRTATRTARSRSSSC